MHVALNNIKFISSLDWVVVSPFLSFLQNVNLNYAQTLFPLDHLCGTTAELVLDQ